MRSMLKAGLVVLTLAAMPVAVQAGTLEGVAIGAGTGAVIAGPRARSSAASSAVWSVGRTSCTARVIALAGSTTTAIAVAVGAKRSTIAVLKLSS